MIGLHKKEIEQVPQTLEATVGSSIITVKNVEKVYHGKKGDTVAMKDCNMEVLENEFICIIGPSGCGKSTLLRMLAGLDFPTGGKITAKDKTVTGPGADRGMVFQTYTLFPWMTVEENVKFGVKSKKCQRTNRMRLLLNILRPLDLISLPRVFQRSFREV